MKNTFIFLLLIVTSFTSYSQCDADFSAYNVNGIFQFIPKVQRNVLTYNFGDGSNDTTAQLVYHYYPAGSGSYTICAVHTDTILMCSDTVCKTITAPNCNVKTILNWVSSNNTGYFTATPGMAGSSYTWSFGDGTKDSTVADSTVTHIFPDTGGTYTVCVIQNGGACKDTACITVTVPKIIVSCNASFSYVDSNGLITFNVDSFSSGVNYSWNFGDTNTWMRSVLSPSISYTYKDTGSYLVCLAAQFLGCADTVCMMVDFKSFNSKLTGIITNNGFVNNAKVYLIEYDSTGHILTALDSTLSRQGYFEFTNTIQGKNYLIKAIPPTSGSGSGLPTYYGNTLFWSSASTASAGDHVFIILQSGTWAGGSGFIGGLVSQGANKKGDKLHNILIMLIDGNEDVSHYTYSNLDGEFEFENIAYGTYDVYTEVPGIPTTSASVTIDAQNESVYNIWVEVNSTYVSSGFVGIGESAEFHNYSIYPNPTNDQVIIDFAKGEVGRYTLLNELGNIELDITISSSSERIDLSNFKAGIYFLQIETNTQKSINRIIKF